MSIASEITRLQTAKADLKTAIEGKGVTVPSSAKLDAYPALVESIQGSIEDLITKENLVRIIITFGGTEVTLDASNNFTNNDALIMSTSINNSKFIFNEITVEGGNNPSFVSDWNKHNILKINNITFAFNFADGNKIYIYLNDDVIGTINYDD